MLCVISHDAGGAQVLASYIARTGTRCEFVLDGPARKIFENRLGHLERITLVQALEHCDEFLCGTSWQSDLEWHAIGAAKAERKPVRVFLDHWVNYRERFIRDDVEILPDELWVGDPMAHNVARKTFPEIPVQLVPNPYFEDVRDELAIFESDADLRLGRPGLHALFVCEPLTEHGLKEFGDPHHWGFTEFDALRYFYANLHAVGAPVERIVIRPHPSEMKGKYDAIASEFGAIASIGGEKSLLQEVAECDLVVGCESMAMVVGLVAGRRVISAIPPSGKPCILPQSEIESLKHLVQDFVAVSGDNFVLSPTAARSKTVS